MNRNCRTCHHSARPVWEEPCKPCSAWDNWEPKMNREQHLDGLVEAASKPIVDCTPPGYKGPTVLIDTLLDAPGTLKRVNNALPEDDAVRGDFPMFDGLVAYFPNALAEVSKVSKIGNDQHNPGQPMHWARNKSTDHENKIMRHLVDAGGVDHRGVRHSARLAWRALALLQEELEREQGLTPSRASVGRPF